MMFSKLFTQQLQNEIINRLVILKFDSFEIDLHLQSNFKFINNNNLNDSYKVTFIEDKILDYLLNVWRID